MSCLEQALLVLGGASKAAFLVAEKLAFHQFGRNGAAIDRNKRFARTRPPVMYQPGDDFLSGAGLATDIHRRLAAGQLADGLLEFEHGR